MSGEECPESQRPASLPEQPGSSQPAFSVIVLTYNHEQSIAEALDSILSQVEAPAHEILIAEDWSTDRTRAIVSEYQRRFPERIQLLPRTHNLGLSANLEDAWRRCRGRYISLLEGDDRWTSPHKLARVYAALEAHPEWVGCYHQVYLQNSIHPERSGRFPEQHRVAPLTLGELLEHNWIPTYSCMTYRRGIVAEFPAIHRQTISGDWLLNIFHSQFGDIGYLPEMMTEYRIHAAGLASGMKEAERWYGTLVVWWLLDQYFAGKYAAEIQQARAKYLQRMQATLSDLRKTQRYYHRLQLDHLAGFIKRLTGFFRGHRP